MKKWIPKKMIDRDSPLDIGAEIKRQIEHAMRTSGPSGIEALNEIEDLIQDMRKAMGG